MAMELCELQLPLRLLDFAARALVPLMICTNAWNSLPSYWEPACPHEHKDLWCAYFAGHSMLKM